VRYTTGFLRDRWSDSDRSRESADAVEQCYARYVENVTRKCYNKVDSPSASLPDGTVPGNPSRCPGCHRAD
jgi:hypothetical protein